MERKFQIGVMGSAADLEYAQESRDIAYEIGKFIAQREGVFVYGAEKDVDSLPTVASRGAKDAGGLVVGITYGSKKRYLGGEHRHCHPVQPRARRWPGDRTRK